MTRPVDWRSTAPRTLTPNSASGSRNDPSLSPGVSVNGASPRLLGTDERRSLLRVRCAGCKVVGVVYGNFRDGRLLPIVTCDVRCVEDWTPNPPVAYTACVEVKPGAVVEADCPAHGLVRVSGDKLLATARKMLAALAGPNPPAKTPIVDVIPERRRAHIPPAALDAMSLQEVDRLIGWSPPRDTPV